MEHLLATSSGAGFAAGKMPHACPYTRPPAVIHIEVPSEGLERQMGSRDFGEFNQGWGTAGGSSVVDLPFVECTAGYSLRHFHPHADGHGQFIEVMLLTLGRKRLPLFEGTVQIVGPCVSGRHEGARLAAVKLLGSQGAALKHAETAQLASPEWLRWLRQLSFEFAASAVCDGTATVVEASVEAMLALEWEPLVVAMLLDRISEWCGTGRYGDRSAHLRLIVTRATPRLRTFPDHGLAPQNPLDVRIRFTNLQSYTCTDPGVPEASAEQVYATRPFPRPEPPAPPPDPDAVLGTDAPPDERVQPEPPPE